MITGWEQLEEAAAELISGDDPQRPRNSGGTKKEEDVIGSNIMIQCKFTNAKNMSILKKDLDRLIDSADLLSKFPIFLTSNSSGDTVISIPISDNTEEIVKQICSLIITSSEIANINENINLYTTKNQLEAITIKIQKIKSRIRHNADFLTSKLNKMLDTLEHKYVDLITCNLFDGDKNGTK